MQLGKRQGRHGLTTALYGTAFPRHAPLDQCVRYSSTFGCNFHRRTGYISRAWRVRLPEQLPSFKSLLRGSHIFVSATAHLSARPLVKWERLSFCFGRHRQHDFQHDAAPMALCVTFLYRFLLAVAAQEQTNILSPLIMAGIQLLENLSSRSCKMLETHITHVSILLCSA